MASAIDVEMGMVSGETDADRLTVTDDGREMVNGAGVDPLKATDAIGALELETDFWSGCMSDAHGGLGLGLGGRGIGLRRRGVGSFENGDHHHHDVDSGANVYLHRLDVGDGDDASDPYLFL